MSATTRWWWIRHAPVTGHGGRLYGQNDVVADVSDAASFKALADRLPVGAIWVTSNLRRTHQTAAAIAAAGLPTAPPLVEPDIAEQHLGQWQGLTHAEMEAARDGAYHRFWIAPADHTPPGGESFVDVTLRVARAVRRITARHAGRDIVAVGHGGSIRAALATALDVPPERALAFTIDNLSLTRLDHVGEGAWRVVTVNLPAKVVP